jgi:hypothetical protein
VDDWVRLHNSGGDGSGSIICMVLYRMLNLSNVLCLAPKLLELLRVW